ncbi:NUDIX domain-containing protein [Pacificibacter marinus]|uniref:Nudix hydrolase domain-containing protein n=1 Tax=Pacificibacter marinus TaxID=658057 RepID=A0A1Y5TEI1_9RHOB|nr:NUDIX domain-containing protein [Pacificibacter marinus]SEL14775.1 8-oxo-dGTP diphosphatase [Pacificibacter marinus]SLN62316.1 hypothetical protein PAM7971_03232 [Pacificibacter marinus]
MTDFGGAKIAILRGDNVLTLQRDDRPDIPYPGEWDLPGGGRERDETPIQTATRELLEELNVRLDPNKIIYSAEELADNDSQERVHFFMARWDDLFDDGIILGDEGLRWCWMPTPDFLSRKDVVKPLRGRLRRALKVRAF